MKLKAAAGLVLTFLAVALVTALAPLEKTLGINARVVYLHGAWVWAALLTIMASGLAGAVGLLLRRPGWQRWSLALGRTGLLLWLTFLPMSLYVMQSNWNGLFLDEPRFRLPLNLAVVGLLLQVGLVFFSDLRLASAANLGYAAVVMFVMSQAETVLHPESPIFSGNAGSIRYFFIALLALLLLAAGQVAWLMVRAWKQPGQAARREAHR